MKIEQINALGGRYYTQEELKAFRFGAIGENVKVHTRASLYGIENISLGDNVRIDDFSVLVATGPLRVGSFVHIPNFCFVGARAGVTILDYVTLAPGVKIFSAADDYSGESMTGPLVPSSLVASEE